jgi:hypothetical protein
VATLGPTPCLVRAVNRSILTQLTYSGSELHRVAEYLDSFIPRYRRTTARTSPPTLTHKRLDRCSPEILASTCACRKTGLRR